MEDTELTLADTQTGAALHHSPAVYYHRQASASAQSNSGAACRPSQPSMAAVPAAKAGEDKAEISGITQAQQNGHATNSTNGFKQESLKSR